MADEEGHATNDCHGQLVVGSAGSGARQEVGARGEDAAVAELERQGMQIVARNWRCPLGEIDIIAVETVAARRTLVFCEVKCRTGLGFGHPLESVTSTKLRKLRKLAAHWLMAERARADNIRLDAMGVIMLPGERPSLFHVRGIG
jgi:putative endonuclease